MKSKFPLIFAAIVGSLTTLAVVQFFEADNVLSSHTGISASNSSQSQADCVVAVQRVSALTESSLQSGQDLPSQQAVSAAPQLSAAKSAQPPSSEQPPPLTAAEQQEQILQFSVAPHVANLTAVVKLAAAQQQKVSELLQSKAATDFANWQKLQQQLQSSAENPAELSRQFHEFSRQSSADYAAALQKTLSSTQLQEYIAYETSLLELRKQQQISQFSSSFTKLNNLDEFQRQEITRLSSSIFKASSEILLGATASPYAPSMIETDPDVLQQLRSVLTESQLKESGWQ